MSDSAFSSDHYYGSSCPLQHTDMDSSHRVQLTWLPSALTKLLGRLPQAQKDSWQPFLKLHSLETFDLLLATCC